MATPPAPPDRFRVVLADDNADLLRALGEVIDAEPGLACVARVDAADAVVAAVRATAPQAVVLDLRLRGASGFDILDRLRHGFPAIHVVMFSGHAQPELEVEARRRGASAFVTKAGDLDALLGALHALREGRVA